jgi:hypothetical protein
MHWKKAGGRGARASMLINGLGAFATGLTTCIVIVAKFTEGAWITVIAILGLIWLMSALHRACGTAGWSSAHARLCSQEAIWHGNPLRTWDESGKELRQNLGKEPRQIRANLPIPGA